MRRRALLAVLGLVGAAGCAGQWAPLEVPPGHRVVVGRVDLRRFEAPEALLVLVREDGTFRHGLRAGPGITDFAIALPPGRYRVAEVRLIDDRFSSPTQTVLYVRVAFDVGPEPAAYLGTLRLVSTFGQRLAAEVADEYQTTVPLLRARQPGIPEPVARSLFRAG